MRIPTTLPTTKLRNTACHRLLLLATVLATASTSHAGLRLERVGNPVFDISNVGGSLDASSRVAGHNIDHSMEDLLGPSFLNLSPGNGKIRPQTLLEPIGIPVDQHIREAMAESEMIQTDAFVVDDAFWMRSALHLLVLTPSESAPDGISPTQVDGPVIPNDIFPLEVKRHGLIYNGAAVNTGDTTTIQSLESYGAGTRHSKEYDLTATNFGEIVLPRTTSAGFGHSRQGLVGDYERRYEIRDNNGDGWNVFEKFTAVARPTDIAGDLNYNGELDMGDLQILEQNVAVAPDQPSGRFLRLDLDDDAAVDLRDIHHWVTDLKSTFVGDTNLDGEVQFDDFLALSANFGQAGGWAEGDFDANERVDFPDFLALSANFGNTAAAPNASAAAVPEPTGLSIAFFGLLGLFGFRKRR